MHYLYTPISINGAPFIAKLTIEEYDLEAKHRAYNLQRIVLSELSRAQFSDMTAVNRGKFAYNSDALTVAQLYSLVKTYGKDFTANPVNPAMLNADGTPRKVYHATNAENIDVFQSGNSAGTIYFGFTKEEARAAARGKKYVREYYLTRKSP